MLSSSGWRIEPGDDRRPRRGADRRIGPCVQIPKAARGQRVYIRRCGILVAVAAQLGAGVFAGKPENVGPFSGLRLGDRSARGDRKEPATLHW